MHKQILGMIKDYNEFEHKPALITFDKLLKLIQNGKMILPLDTKSITLTSSDDLSALNHQWLSMSNMSDISLAVNKDSPDDFGKSILTGGSVKNTSSTVMLVHGIKVLLPFLLAYRMPKYSFMNRILFSIKDNRFIAVKAYGKKYVTGDFIPVGLIYGKSYLNATGRNFDVPRSTKDALYQKIMLFMRKKLKTYTFPVKICQQLSDWQQSGWSRVLEKDD